MKQPSHHRLALQKPRLPRWLLGTVPVRWVRHGQLAEMTPRPKAETTTPVPMAMARAAAVKSQSVAPRNGRGGEVAHGACSCDSGGGGDANGMHGMLRRAGV